MWTTEEIKKMNGRLLQDFQKARILNPNDPELLVHYD